jgi:hypothetical protein
MCGMDPSRAGTELGVYVALQIAANVDSRIAFTLPFFNTEILAIEIAVVSTHTSVIPFVRSKMRKPSLTRGLSLVGPACSGESMSGGAVS